MTKSKPGIAEDDARVAEYYGIDLASPPPSAAVKALEALEPFARIGLDILEHHPGWANKVFEETWAGYPLTYVDFERAAAIAIAFRQSAALASPPSGEESWQMIDSRAKSGEPVLGRGGVYHGMPFAVAYRPSEFKPDEPWLNLINDHRLPEHCVTQWQPIEGLTTTSLGSET